MTLLHAPLLAVQPAQARGGSQPQQGRVEEGRRLLATAYERMTEGFATADVREADELLQLYA